MSSGIRFKDGKILFRGDTGANIGFGDNCCCSDTVYEYEPASSPDPLPVFEYEPAGYETLGNIDTFEYEPAGYATLGELSVYEYEPATLP